MLNALEGRFAGLGSADTIRVEVSSNGRELMIYDTTFGFVYHAWVDAGEMPLEAVHRREVRRAPFLVQNLLADLENGEKTFVSKGMGSIAEEEVFPLAVALRTYGHNTLLFVTLADADHRAGTVEARAPGFLVSYLDRFAPGANAHDFLLDQWVLLCRETCRLRLALTARRTRAFHRPIVP